MEKRMQLSHTMRQDAKAVLRRRACVALGTQLCKPSEVQYGKLHRPALAACV